VHHVLKHRIANDQQIEIASRAQLTTGGRPKHKCELDLIAKRRQPVSEQVRQTRRLGKQALQLREDRCVLVGSEIYLAALHLPLQQPGGRQEFQLALHGANSGADLACDCPQIIGLVRVSQEPAEDATPGAAKKHRRGISRNAQFACSQDGNNRTHNGNIDQAWSWPLQQRCFDCSLLS
jgi:hypothetical protein